MAQIIPPITSLPIDSSAAPSVEDIQDRLPSICVDYLSHDWSEEDVWASWRSMTRHKHEIANGVRLENASWRTWQKQRNKLKTISPETLNWLKDSDVTWLYGPLHTAHVEPVRPLKVAGAEERLGIETGSASIAGAAAGPSSAVPFKKPILKHRTLSEMLTIPMPSSPILEATGDDDMDDLEGDDRPPLLKTKSDTNIIRARSGVRRKSPPRGPISSGKHTPMEGEMHSPKSDHTASGKRHISFNTFVEQCVAVDDPSEVRIDEDSDEEEMLEMRSSSSSRSSRPSLSRNTSSAGGQELLTIAMIAPTILKTPGVINVGSLPNMVYAPPPEYLSPNAQNSPQSYDFPSPVVQTAQRWQSGAAADDEDDEYGSVGYDYFNGPDLSGSGEPPDKRRNPAPQQPVTAHMGQSYGRAPTVAPPPAQPKWRQAQSASLESSASPSSSSSTSSLRDQVTSPQQTKGILKVRPPGSTPPPEPSSPPSTYFNYNPSAATGIGGMPNGTRYLDHYGNATSPPLVSPPGSSGASEERGRSHSRDRGSSAENRSSSRGTSTSASSISPGASRSPVGAARRSIASTQVQPPSSAPQLEKLQEGQEWDPMDVDRSPDRASTPTPHSSPQIAFRPLKDTSPASLPHTSSRNPDSVVSDLDAPSSVSPPPSAPASASRATTAHVSTNAAPILSKPTTGAQRQTKAQVQSNGGTNANGGGGESGYGNNGGMDDDDGSSIMGRAANIANTAKDLLGALWYGANEQQGQGGKGRAGGHRRGQSLG